MYLFSAANRSEKSDNQRESNDRDVISYDDADWVV